MKKLLSLLVLLYATTCFCQKEDYYGPFTISFHGIICNRPTNDDPLGMDGVGDEVSVHFWNWASVATNRANYNGLSKIYGEDFLLPFRVKAGTATINGGLKAGDSYYREEVNGDNNPQMMSNYAIFNSFCSENTVIAIVPTIWERDNGTFGITPIQDFGVATNDAFGDMAFRRKIWDFSDSYVYNDTDPFGFIVPGRNIGLDARYTGMFTANKNKLASRPIGLLPDWNFSSQVLILTSKMIKIISEKDFGYGKGILPIQYNEESMGNTVGHGNYILLLRFVADIKLRNPPSAIKQYRVGIQVDTIVGNQPGRFSLQTLNNVVVTAAKTVVYFPQKIASGTKFKVSQIAMSGTNYYKIFQPDSIIRDTDIIVKAEAVFPPTNQKIGVKVNAVGVGEEFIFSIGTGKQVSITRANEVAYFPGTFSTGTNYTISQVSGPRSCQLVTPVGTVSDKNIIISATCGTQPLSMGKLNVTGIQSGETFTFNIGYGRTFSTPFSTIANMGGFNVGDSLMIKQTGGPRPCVIKYPSSTVPNESFIVQCDCGQPVSTTPVKLNGVFTAPAGTKIVLQLNNKDTIALGQPGNANTNWIQSMNFKFQHAYLPGTAYSATIKSAPANLGCAIYENGTGTIADSIVVRVRCDKSYDLVSRSSDDKILSTYYESFTPVTGGMGEDEGRYIAFGAYGKGMDGSTGSYRQIFLRDRKNGTTKLISKSASGAEANGNCQVPAISADGKSVAFESYATNLAANDNNGARDIYLWQESTNSVTLISKSISGMAANSESMDPTISGDGSVIAYTSNASDISPDAKGGVNVFIHYTASGTSELISKDYETEKAVSGSVPSISDDGNKIAFCSFSDRLVQNDKNSLWDIFIWERSSPLLKRISMTAGGGERNQGTESSSRMVAPSLSGDGQYVVFSTTASNMVAGDMNEMQDIFICNTSGGNVRRMSTNGSADSNGDSPISQGEKIGVSYDGRWITYATNADNLGTTKGNIVIQNTQNGKIFPVTNIIGGSVGRPMISSNGSYVVAGCSEKYDKRFPSSGVFLFYPLTGNNVPVSKTK